MQSHFKCEGCESFGCLSSISMMNFGSEEEVLGWWVRHFPPPACTNCGGAFAPYNYAHRDEPTTRMQCPRCRPQKTCGVYSGLHDDNPLRHSRLHPRQVLAAFAHFCKGLAIGTIGEYTEMCPKSVAIITGIVETLATAFNFCLYVDTSQENQFLAEPCLPMFLKNTTIH